MSGGEEDAKAQPVAFQRRWLASHLLDPNLSDAEAYSVVAHHPLVTAAHGKMVPDNARRDRGG